ncbi:type II secretion system F family protein [Altererythrobacter sp. SALINAS58]|uniref:type II secretion system F family protein n=1 Tax=Alteripontixanthobacter muriae TaxID=2705546 RepID=UPI0015754F67|nr:type II secretion system F family protein [Alteripontixanthobacter muriae]NTZ41949.1 type II secretion system F family protein [Alteripontixanthobacter muriae]
MSGDILRIFILLAIFASIFLLVQLFAERLASRRSHRSAVNKRLQMIGAGEDREIVTGRLLKNQPQAFTGLPPFIGTRLQAFERRVFSSGISFTVNQLLAAMAATAVFLFLLMLFVMFVAGPGISFGTLQLALFFSMALAVFLPNMIVGRMALKRRKKMEEQFPVALDIFVRALRSGHPVASAIDLLTHEMGDPIGSEFGIVSDEVSYGADLVSALSNMADRWNLEDMRMFVVSLSVQTQTGGNLAEILDNISKVIRDRHQMFMKVRALSSEGRMTGWMLSVLPVAAFLMIFIGTPDFYLGVANEPVFIYGSIALAIFYIIGVYTIRRMIDLKV